MEVCLMSWKWNQWERQMITRATWLSCGSDLANTYGSIPHKLVKETLRRYHYSRKISDLIFDYYDNFQMNFTTREIVSDWHSLERGIITRCTISAILFILAMNMVVKSAEVECQGPMTRMGVHQPPIRAYMDNLIMSTSFRPGLQMNTVRPW